MAYKVTDKDQETATATFTITVEADTQPSLADVNDVKYITASTYTLNLPESPAGNEPLVYTLSPAVPGMTFDATARTLSGIPSTAGDYEMTYKVEDADKETDTATFEIEVEADTMPMLVQVMDRTYVLGPNPISISFNAGYTDVLNGNPPFDYSLEGDLPNGLTFQKANRFIAGRTTASTMAGDYSLTLKVTDVDGDTDSAGFTLTLEANTQPVLTTINNQSYIEDSAIDTLNLPMSTLGNPPLTYTLTPDVPGLTFDAAAQTLTGTPSTPDTYMMTYTVKDTHEEADTKTFDIVVVADLMPSFSDGVTGETDYIAGQSVSLTFPMATGGNGDLTHSFTTKPSWLTASGNSVSGTAVAGSHDITYTATDEDMDSVELMVTLMVEQDTTPTFSGATAQNIDAVASASVSVTLPTATGGNGELMYSISGNPSWLTLSGNTVSGTASATDSPWTITYTATDADGDPTSIAFILTVEEDTMPTFSNTVVGGNKEYIAGQDVILTFPSATGGNQPLTYSFTTKPSWLTATGNAVSGTAVAGSHEITYTATDKDGDNVGLTVTITVVADTMPTLSDISNKDYTTGTAISTLTLPESTTGNAPLKYTLTPDVPGLTFNATARTLSGTPTTANTYSMTYKVEDDNGDSAMETFTITVTAADTAPSFSGITVAQKTYTVNTAIATLTLPEANLGNAPITYSLSPSISGLSFDSATRQLTGTPAVGTAGSHTMTYTATDSDDDSDDLNFDITINHPGDFSFTLSASSGSASINLQSGSVSYGSASVSGTDCISNPTTISGVSITITESALLKFNEVGNYYEIVTGTRISNKVCAHSPSEAGTYRLRAEIILPGESSGTTKWDTFTVQ